jgi:hypothetical protein
MMMKNGHHVLQKVSYGRWKDFRRYFPGLFSDETRKETDVWHQFLVSIQSVAPNGSK